MKKIVLLITLFAPLAVFAQKPASVDSLIQVVNELKKEFHEYDSISRLHMGYLYRNLDKPRFKMYQTENIYNLLKLDTRTGRV